MAAVEARMAHGRGRVVAFANAGNPPAPDLFRMRGVFHVHDHVELVVQRVARLEIGRTGRKMGVLTVDKPETMNAARVGAGGVEKSDALGLRWVAYIVNPHTNAG